jgi:hypothetical protein
VFSSHLYERVNFFFFTKTFNFSCIFNPYAVHYFFTTFLNEHNFKVKSELIMWVRLLCNYINKITKVTNTSIKYSVL